MKLWAYTKEEERSLPREMKELTSKCTNLLCTAVLVCSPELSVGYLDWAGDSSWVLSSWSWVFLPRLVQILALICIVRCLKEAFFWIQGSNPLEHFGCVMQVSSATATFAMTFSSSMSVVEYYLLKRFPVPYGESIASQGWELRTMIRLSRKTRTPYFLRKFLSCYAALYFIAVATLAALVGQQIIRRLIFVLGRASLIIFVLASTIFISAITLGMFRSMFRYSSFDWRSLDC